MTRWIHLASGLVLFTFVLTHLANHALGLISLDALEYGRKWFLMLWRSRIGGIVLYGSLLAHFLLALWSIFQRRSLKLRLVGWVQLLLGLCIPVLLTSHILNTRAAYELYGQIDSYQFELAIFFVLNPMLIYKQMLLLLVVWGHGCIGLHRWLRLKPGYREWQWLAYAFSLLLPAAALSGIWVAGRDIAILASQPGWLAQMMQQANGINSAQLTFFGSIENSILSAAAVLLAATLLLRPLRRLLRRQRGLVKITYPDGKQITVSDGTSILEASRLNHIPHASVCGGRGRCSTCRVRILRCDGELSTPSASEAKVLDRIGARADIRLACQTRPSHDCSIAPLLEPDTSVNEVGLASADLVGQEQLVYVMFADLRDFTALSEQKLPYDLVFLLNRYFAAMGSAISASGGYVDKFIGDGVMALFGLNTDSREGAKAALRSAHRMSDELTKLNQLFENDLPMPLRMGIGIHGGSAIVGTMGYGETRNLTAIGDTVNTASRLEGVTKSLGVQLVFSQIVAENAELPDGLFETREIDIRGRHDRLSALIVPEMSELERLSWITQDSKQK